MNDVGEVSASMLRLLSADQQPRRQLANAISSFHSAAVLPHWKALHNLLAHEAAAAARVLGAGGVDALLATLRPSMLRWQPPELHAVTGWSTVDRVHLGGRGLVLTPSVFVGHHHPARPRNSPGSSRRKRVIGSRLATARHAPARHCAMCAFPMCAFPTCAFPTCAFRRWPKCLATGDPVRPE
jgi:hypothetical protein